MTLREDDPRIDGMIKDGYNTDREPLVQCGGSQDKTVQQANKIRELRNPARRLMNCPKPIEIELKPHLVEKPPEAYAKAMSSVPSARAAISDAYRKDQAAWIPWREADGASKTQSGMECDSRQYGYVGSAGREPDGK